MRNNDGFEAILVASAVLILFGDWSEEPKCRGDHKVAMEQEVPAPEPNVYTVSFEVELDSIYTGNQTMLVYQSEEIIEVPSWYSEHDGLPVTGLFPGHTRVTFTRYNGEECILRVPVVAKVVTALVTCEGTQNNIYMTATVMESNTDGAHIRAVPFIEGETT